MPDPSEPKKPTILCVDDDTLVLRSLREQLQRGLGSVCDIEVAASGEEALQLLHELAAEGTDVPLLISDQIMPGMRGAQLMEQVHERYPAMLKVMLSGHADAAAVGHAVNQADLYRIVKKPWQELDLLLTIQEALHKVERERKIQGHTAALEAANAELKQSIELLHAIMDATVDGLLVVDLQGTLVQCNRQLLDLWTVPPELLAGDSAAPLAAHLRSQLSDPNALAIDAATAPRQAVMLELSNGNIIEYSSRAHCIHGRQIGMVYGFRDVTERERSATIISRQALLDPVTGLANRHHFDNTLVAALEQARQAGTPLGVLFVDLDRFKCINDTYGHAVGDELLCCVAERLQNCVRDCDLLARWGGDEFTVLLPQLRTPDEACIVAQRILDALASPMQLGGHALHTSASIGVAVFPDDGDDAPTLLKKADIALYQVKDEGRNGYRRCGGDKAS